jgi:hypothetical protein
MATSSQVSTYAHSTRGTTDCHQLPLGSFVVELTKLGTRATRDGGSINREIAALRLKAQVMPFRPTEVTSPYR